MPWVKLDDRFWSEPKVEKAGNEAAGVFARMLSYCGQHLTDGHVTENAAKFIAGRRKPIDALLEVGLIEQNGNGYVIPRYLDFNPDADQAKAIQAARSEAGRRGGLKSGASRRASSKHGSNG